MVLTDDCLVIFAKFKKNSINFGKIVFWSSLYAITDLQLNKKENKVSIKFYDLESNSEFNIKLLLTQLLFFRQCLFKKMSNLTVRYEKQRLVDGQAEKRLSTKEINNLITNVDKNIEDIEKYVKLLRDKINNDEINDYTVNTFTTLCGKVIEFYSGKGDERYMEYRNMMQKILSQEKVNNNCQSS